MWKNAIEKYKAKLQEQVHELIKDINNLNDEEDKLYPDKEIKLEEITPEELEKFSKRLSYKLNEGLAKVYECSDCSNCTHKSECTKAQ